MVVENKFSETFVNDLEKFKIWLDENEYYLNDIVTGEKVIFEKNMIGFNEPSRNKLECYVKELIKYYSLVKEDEEVDDIKSMIKNFRQNKPKKVKNNIKTKKEKNIKITKEKETKQDEKLEIENIKNEKDEIETILKKNKVDIIVKDSLDTEDVCYIDTLEFCTADLEKVFGKPLKNGGENDKHQYEWKILVVMESKEIIYSIYNWKDKNGQFKGYNENKWHIGTVERCIKDKSFGCECKLSLVKTFIKDKLKLENRLDLLEKKDDKFKIEDKIKVKKDIKSKNEIKDKIENKVLTEDSIMQLFNLTDTEMDIIDIDDICFQKKCPGFI